jgi:hypothetical protein
MEPHADRHAPAGTRTGRSSEPDTDGRDRNQRRQDHQRHDRGTRSINRPSASLRSNRRPIRAITAWPWQRATSVANVIAGGSPFGLPVSAATGRPQRAEVAPLSPTWRSGTFGQVDGEPWRHSVESHGLALARGHRTGIPPSRRGHVIGNAPDLRPAKRKGGPRGRVRRPGASPGC